MIKHYRTKLQALFFITVLGVIAPTKTFAETFLIDGLEYTSIDNNTVEVGAPLSSEIGGAIVIPSAVVHEGKEWKVVRIMDYGFAGLTTPLTSVQIPHSVTSIGEHAFDGCSALTSVTIPNSVTSIERFAFYNCSSLTSVVIPNSVTSIGLYAFSGCSSLTSVTIPNSVTSIERFTFYNCSSLTSVMIPNSVTSIEGSAFYNCSSLRSVTIPNSVTSIGQESFGRCSSLRSVYMEAYTPPKVEDDAFYEVHAVLFVPYGTVAAYSQQSWTSVFDLINVFEPSSLPTQNSVNQNSKISLCKSGDTLEILNLEENEPIKIYDFKGVCVYNGSNHTIRLPKNCGYILRTASQTLKFMF